MFDPGIEALLAQYDRAINELIELAGLSVQVVVCRCADGPEASRCENGRVTDSAGELAEEI